MRIRIQNLLLGVILLLGISLAPRAYTLNTAVQNTRHSLLTPPFRRQTVFLTPDRTSGRRVTLFQSSLASSEEQDGSGEGRQFYNVMEVTTTTEHEPISTQSDKKRNIASIVAVVALFLASQFLGNEASPASTSTAAAGGKGVLFSAVSASLLRQQKGGGRSSKLSLFSLQNIMLGILLWQGAHQLEHLVKLLTLCGGIFSSWYMGVLHQFPLITKTVTTAVIGVLGDTAAQFLEERIRAKKNGRTTEWWKNFDKRRGLAVFGDSVLVSGPLLHFAYNIMESIIPVSGPHASLAALSQVLIDNFILDSIFVAVMFVTTGIAEGYARQIIPQLKKDFFTTVKAGWVTSLLLIPLEFVCFRFLPLNFRVLGMNIIDIFWEAMISYMVHRRRRMAKLQEEAVAVATSDPVSALENMRLNASSA